MPSPSVSILMPSYQTAAYLPEAVASVRAQTFPDWELLIVDDGSTDGSADLAQDLARQDVRIRAAFHPENRGAAAARSTALALARGRRVAFLDSDDRWKPRKLERQLAFMDECGAAFAYTAYDVVRADGASLGVRVRAPERQTRGQLLVADRIGCLTAVCERALLERAGMPGLRKRSDYALWLRLLRFTPCAFGLDESLAEYRRRPGSLSSGKLGLIPYNWRVYRQQEGLSALRSLGLLLGDAAHSAEKSARAWWARTTAGRRGRLKVSPRSLLN